MPRKSARKSAVRRVVMIRTVSERYGIHPQTLRLYEREGLLLPERSAGNTRLYDERALQRLETILTLTRDMGVNLAGVEVILGLKDRLVELERELERLRGELREQLTAGAYGVRRRYALVKVEGGPLKPID